MNFRYSYMAKQQKEKPKVVGPQAQLKPKAKEESFEEERDDFDFGGLPKDVPFKRNMGCGG